MDGKWICIAVSTLYHHGDKGIVVSEIQRIFGDDLDEVRVVCDESMEASGEYFTLIKCRNYPAHIDDLRDSPAVVRVVSGTIRGSSYNEPAFLSEQDVDTFAESVDREEPPEEFVPGDVVVVVSPVEPSEHGYLEGLQGIVYDTHPGSGKCSVYFRFHSSSFKRRISVESLHQISNVFENLRFRPFTRTVKRSSLFRTNLNSRALEAMKKIVHCDKIRWKKCRKHEGSYWS